MDGSESERSQAAERVADELRRRNPAWTIELWDERLTTVEAERTLRDTGTRRGKRKQKVDGLAASLILQGYLESHPG